MKYIKLNYIDGDYQYTRINGTDKDILKHYSEYNVLTQFSSEHKQITSIEVEKEVCSFELGGNMIKYLFTQDAGGAYVY